MVCGERIWVHRLLICIIKRERKQLKIILEAAGVGDLKRDAPHCRLKKVN